MSNTLKLAIEAGFTPSRTEPLFLEMLERFEGLVRADEKHRLVELCKTLDEPDTRFRYDYRRGVLDCVDLINLKSG